MVVVDYIQIAAHIEVILDLELDSVIEVSGPKGGLDPNDLNVLEFADVADGPGIGVAAGIVGVGELLWILVRNLLGPGDLFGQTVSHSVFSDFGMGNHLQHIQIAEEIDVQVMTGIFVTQLPRVVVEGTLVQVVGKVVGEKTAGIAVAIEGYLLVAVEDYSEVVAQQLYLVD